MLNKIKSLKESSETAVNKAFENAVRQTGAVVDSETARQLKARAISAFDTAKTVARNLSDLNGDGKVDAEDIKVAATKAGLAWDKIDPDLKTAMVAGGVAGVGVNFIPLVGQALAVPTFAATTAYFFLVAKLKSIKSRPKGSENEKARIEPQDLPD